MRKLEYTLVTTWDIDRFEKLVDIALQNRWEPQGGVAVTIQENGNRTFTQAFVREIQ